MLIRSCVRRVCCVLAVLTLTSGAIADEGMCCSPDAEQDAQGEVRFEPTAQWLEHVRSRRCGSTFGGSASFVSADGW